MNVLVQSTRELISCHLNYCPTNTAGSRNKGAAPPHPQPPAADGGWLLDGNPAELVRGTEAAVVNKVNWPLCQSQEDAYADMEQLEHESIDSPPPSPTFCLGSFVPATTSPRWSPRVFFICSLFYTFALEHEQGKRMTQMHAATNPQREVTLGGGVSAKKNKNK